MVNRWRDGKLKNPSRALNYDIAWDSAIAFHCEMRNLFSHMLLSVLALTAPSSRSFEWLTFIRTVAQILATQH
jgi:hypothetical protein